MSAPSAGFVSLLRPLRDLGEHVRNHRRLFVLVVVVQLILGVASLAVAPLSVYAAAGVASDATGTTAWIVVLGVVVLAVGVLGWTDSWLAHVLAYRVIDGIRCRAHEAIARLAPFGLRRRRAGDTAAATMADAEALEWFYAHTITQWISAAALVVGTSVAALVWLGPVGLVVPLAQIAVMAIPRLTLQRARRDGRQLRAAIGSLSTTTVEIRDSARDVILLGLLDQARARVSAGTKGVQRARRAIAIRVGCEQAATEIVFAMTSLTILALVAAEVARGALAPSDLPVVVSAVAAAVIPAGTLAGGAGRLGEMSAAAGRVVEVIEAPASSTWVPPRTLPPTCPDRPGVIEATDVAARYIGRDLPVLTALNLRVDPGEHVAIVGASGAGKTTLAQVLARLLEPTSGSLRLNGQATLHVPPQQSRTEVLLVEQHAHLFTSSVRENLLLGLDRPDDTLWTALEQVGLADHVATLGGLDADVSERGASLSGGQRQRLALARALIRRPDILILDEPTAHLDAVSEQLVLAALRENRAGLTTLVISHRPSTIAWCGRSILLDRGRVVADGTHEQLLREQRAYREVLTEPPAPQESSNPKGGEVR